MSQLHTIMIVLAVVVSAGIVANFLAESVYAWHAEFSSENECRNAVNEATGNKAGEANRICERLIPHDN
jgi:hypothetical protein